jgi:hypothetical protein
MSYTIRNFDKSDDAITQRGRELFASGAVASLEDAGDGEWIATVSDTEDYDVEIELKKKTIEFTDCTCHYFSENDDCKHVAAVLYAIRERAFPEKTKATDKAPKKEKKESNKPKSPLQQLQAIAESADPKDLREFIKNYAVRNMDFTNSFLYHIRQVAVNQEASEEGYKELVRLAVKNSTDQGRHKYADDSQLVKYIKPLIDKVKKHLSDKNYLEATFIIKAVIEELSELKAYSFSGDKSADIVIQCFGFLEAIGVSDVSFMFKDDLFTYTIGLVQAGTVDDTIFEHKLNGLLVVLATDNRKREQLLEIVNAKITKLSPKVPGNLAYRMLSDRLEYLNIKIDLLQQLRRNDEALQLIKDNIHHHDEMRIKAIDQAIKEQEYNYAKKLINDRLGDRSNNIGYRNNSVTWQSYLLQIAQLQNDNKEVVRLGLLIFLETAEVPYYLAAKKHATPEQWKIEIAAFIPKAKLSYNSLNLLHKIYSEENMLDELFDLLKKRLNIYLLQAFSATLLPKYRKEVLALYKSEMNKLAQQPQNSNYNLIREQLKHLIAIGAPETAAELISEYRIRYKNRPAMMERLDKVKI